MDDLKAAWRRDKWDESKGLPGVLLMRWKGSPQDREGYVRRMLSQDTGGLLGSSQRGSQSLLGMGERELRNLAVDPALIEALLLKP